MRNPIAPLVLFCFAADVALGLIFLVDAAIGEPTRLFDLGMEANIPTWYASAQLLLVGLLLGLYAAAHFAPSKPDAWLLALLALLFVALSADETAGVHEWIGYQTDRVLPGGTREATAFARTGIWMFVLGLPLLAFFLFAFHRLRPHLAPHGVLTRYFVGVGIFLLGAAGVEMLVNFVEEGTTAFYLQVFCEEVLEMVGVTILLWGTWDLLSTNELLPVRRKVAA